MKNVKEFSDMLSSKGEDIIPDSSFRIMAAIMKLIDFFGKYSSKHFKTIELKRGQTVIDYGCGPARYIHDASKIVGETGKVIAVDIHPLAIKNVEAKIKKYNLKNVEAILADKYTTTIKSNSADVVYAIDMFHMIKQPTEFLTEICRLLKQDGILIIEDGHQPRSETIQKIKNSGILKILQENKFHLKCKKYA